MIKKIEELKLDEARKIIGGVDNRGCGSCMTCDCDPWGEDSEKASYSLGRILTPKSQGCKPGNLKDPL